jgi:hypothetical protein
MTEEMGFEINPRNSDHDFVVEILEKAYRVLITAERRFGFATTKEEEDYIVFEVKRAIEVIVFIYLPDLRILDFNQLSILLSQQHILASFHSRDSYVI